MGSPRKTHRSPRDRKKPLKFPKPPCTPEPPKRPPPPKPPGGGDHIWPDPLKGLFGRR